MNWLIWLWSLMVMMARQDFFILWIARLLPLIGWFLYDNLSWSSFLMLTSVDERLPQAAGSSMSLGMNSYYSFNVQGVNHIRTCSSFYFESLLTMMVAGSSCSGILLWIVLRTSATLHWCYKLLCNFRCWWLCCYHIIASRIRHGWFIKNMAFIFI